MSFVFGVAQAKEVINAVIALPQSIQHDEEGYGGSPIYVPCLALYRVDFFEKKST
jgi:hypothetical protein